MDEVPPPGARLGPRDDDVFAALAHDLAAIYGFDGFFRWLAPGWRELLGYELDYLLKRSFLDFVHPDDRDASWAIHNATGPVVERDYFENRLRHRDGSYRWLLWSRWRDPDTRLIYALAKDVTDRKLTDARLAESEARYRLLADHSSDAITVSSLEGVFTYVSPAGLAIFGWHPADMVGRRVFDFIHPEDLGSLRAGLRGVLTSPDVITVAARFRRPDGGFRWLESTGQQIRDPHLNRVSSVIGNTRDVNERQAAHLVLQQQALTDPLTGAANRTLLADRLTTALARLDRKPGLVALLLIDVDRFKDINDHYGHEAGDAVLQMTAGRLSFVARPTDSVGRLGGDEFVMVVEGCATVEDVDEIATRIVTTLRAPYNLADVLNDEVRSLGVTSSVGVAITRDHDYSPGALMREADQALYRAKERGRNQHALFDDELARRASQRTTIERTLRAAMDQSTLTLRYQPVVRVADQRIVGAEALLRIIAPDGSELPPRDTLTVAEDSGLIRELDQWVLTRALAEQADALALDPDLFVAINVTARDLADHRFASAVEESLRLAGVPGTALMVEMTERVLADTTDPGLGGVRRLREMGVGIGVDDFGTGYSSLVYLRDLPLDFLKIDRTFLRPDGPGGSINTAILEAIVDLAHALGLTVVAEGVETAEQLDAITQIGCDYAQGWVFSTSLSAADYLLLLRGQRGLSEPPAIDPVPWSRLSESNRRPIHYE